MFPKFLIRIFSREDDPPTELGISRTRKIIIWVVTIGFWLIFFYVKGSE